MAYGTKNTQFKTFNFSGLLNDVCIVKGEHYDCLVWIVT